MTTPVSSSVWTTLKVNPIFPVAASVPVPYPNPKIANSWGSVWISARNNNHKVITRTACDAIPRGPPMDMK